MLKIKLAGDPLKEAAYVIDPKAVIAITFNDGKRCSIGISLKSGEKFEIDPKCVGEPLRRDDPQDTYWAIVRKWEEEMVIMQGEEEEE